MEISSLCVFSCLICLTLCFACLSRFGPGPHIVEVDVELPDKEHTKGSFTIEMAPLDKMPHSIHLFLEQVDHGLWNGHDFLTNAPRLLRTGMAVGSSADFSNFEESGLGSLDFPEYHVDHPHEQWTIGFAGTGPDFYINKGDNTNVHGPGDVDAMVLQEADPCFGFVKEGKAILEKMYALPIKDKNSEFELRSPVRIVKATVLDNSADLQHDTIHLKGKHFFDSAETFTNRRANVFDYQELDCTVYEVKGLIMDGVQFREKPKYYRCIDEIHDHIPYIVEDLPGDMEIAITSGATTLAVAEKSISDDIQHGKVIHLKGRSPKLFNALDENRHKRILNDSKRQGDRSLLMVRVTYSNGQGIIEPKNDAKELQSVFDYADVYRECSGDKLNIIRAVGDAVSSGVMTVSLTQNLSGMTWDVAEIFVSRELEDAYGIHWNTYDFVSYVFPDTINFQGMGGLAYINYYLSMFWDTQVMHKYVFLHELGHNFGHDHSGTDSNSYGDLTGFMGMGDKGTRVCFNGAKSWYFGWYFDRQRSISPSVFSWDGNLMGVDDYLNENASGNNDEVIVQVQGNMQTDMYLMFNRNEGVTADNPTVGNRVAITAQEKDNAKSMQLAILDTNQEYRTPNWEGKGEDLVVKVCSIDTTAHPSCKARVIVFIDNAEKRLSCDGNDAETCSEKTWKKWILRVKSGRTILKSCKWLGKLKARKPGKATWFCNRLGRSGSPRTSQICCNTCQN